MENSVDFVTVHSNRQELRVLERAQDVVNILTSPDRGFEKEVVNQILCIINKSNPFVFKIKRFINLFRNKIKSIDPINQY